MAGLAAAALAALAALAPPAVAAPAWQVHTGANPTAAPGGQVQYVVSLKNVGDTIADGTAGDPIVLGARLGPGLTVEDVTMVFGSFGRFDVSMFGWACTGDGGGAVRGSASVTCRVFDRIGAHSTLLQGLFASATPTVTANVAPGASGTRTSEFFASGAGAGPAETIETVVLVPAAPEFGVSDFDGQVTADAAGSPFTQAAGHPYAASTAIELFADDDSPDPASGTLWPVEPLKDLVVDLPPGFVGNPSAIDRCTIGQLSNSEFLESLPLCPPTSQVGTVRIRANFVDRILYGPVPVFNMNAGSDAPARFGFSVSGSVVLLDAEVRSEDDYGVTVVVRNTPTALPVQATELTLWGDPSDPSHDAERACPGRRWPTEGGPTCASGAPSTAFLRNPAVCTPDGVGLTTTVRATSWLDPSDVKTKSFESHLPPSWPAAPEDWGRPQGPTGCDRVPFDPKLTGQPAVDAQAGEPSGFAFDLTLPQTDDPDVVGQSDLRKAVVTLPQGVRVNPSSAGGLEGCSSAQIKLDERGAADCPDASKIGTLTIDTPLLDEQLRGAVYLATPFDNPFDSLIAIYLVARGPGFHIKLPGHVSPDASKGGQLTTTFDNQPQLPFERLHLEFKGGPRAPIVLPKECGTYTTHATMTGWSGRVVESSSSFTVDQGCGTGFSPGFSAGTETSAAGKSSPFLLRMTRDDADQELKSVSVDMPAGLTGKIADAVLCGEGQAAAGTCGGGSLLGNVTVGAGAGTHPFYITNGRVHITGPYKGAPFGLSIVVPAVAGPFDLGTVVVRSALFVDRHTAEIRVVSDPLPTQLQGIPLDVKDVRVTVDKAGFMINPTNCEEMQVGGRIDSTLGSSVAVSSRFQGYDCQALDLRPRMAIRVGGRNRTQRGRSTPLKTKLRMPAGDANLRQVRVTLPTVLNARLTVINDACTRAEYDSGSDACEFARTGSAVAVTPLLRDPLRGGVYFVRNGNPLPDLFVRLRGQVDFDLVGRITIPGSKRLRTTFDMVPDVPVSMFALRLVSGRDGSVGNAANLCSVRARRARAEVDFVGQNGKTMFSDKRLRVKGCGSRGARAKRNKRGRRGTRRGR